MRSSPRYEDTRAGARLDFIVAHQHVQNTFEDVPRLIVAVVQMERSNQAASSGRTASIAPLGGNKRIVDRTQNLPRERRRNDR